VNNSVVLAQTLRRNAQELPREYSITRLQFLSLAVTWAVSWNRRETRENFISACLRSFDLLCARARASSIWFSFAALFSLVSSQFKARCARVMVTNQADKLRDFRFYGATFDHPWFFVSREDRWWMLRAQRARPLINVRKILLSVLCPFLPFLLDNKSMMHCF